MSGFVQSPPNGDLVRYAERLRAGGAGLLADIGCGAGRNLVPLAAAGWGAIGIDLSWPMLEAARERLAAERRPGSSQLCLAPMEALPVASGSVDLVIAHGIWNLASSADQFRRGVREAARIARPGAALFVFTFSRRTLAPDAEPIAGEPFVFTQFSGQRQCFLTADELTTELAQAGFSPDPSQPLTELNVPRPGTLSAGGPPVIYQAGFLRV